MSSLFEATGMDEGAPRPLADRLRPQVLEEVVGQEHLIGPKGPLGRLLVRDEQGWDFIDEMRPLAGEPVVDKCGNGAFYATDLEQILRSRGIRHLLLLGVTTDVCVSSTMREANDRGFDCLLLEDCCGAATPDLHQGVLNSLEREGGIFGAYADSRAFFEQYLSATAG